VSVAVPATAPLSVPEQIARNRRRAATIIGLVGAVPFVVLALVALLTGLGVAGVAVALVVGVALGWAVYARADRAALAATRARPAPEEQYRRYHNVVDGLCVALGLPKPHLYVVDDPGVNACALGRDPKHAALAVTTGLLEAFNRVELEGVLAQELAHVKSRDTLVTTIAVTLPPAFGRAATGPAGQERADAEAVLLTRYPPGLAAALAKLRDGHAVVRGVRAATAPAWIADPLHASDGSLTERIERLQEL
jgi:heat shock protein HtpX